MPQYRYQLFIPGGNKTALVFGIDGLASDGARRKAIQDAILSRHEQDADGEVEQVGFVNTDAATPELIMAGGEFCGNAMRAAAAYYLDGGTGTMEITVSGAGKPLRAGSDTPGEVWAEMPVLADVASSVRALQNSGFYWVTLEGISHLVVPQVQSAPYLSRMFACARKEEQLDIALTLLEEIITTHALPIGDAYGVMFLEHIADVLKMHPFVHVKTAGTTYYETGCGSGAVSIGLVSSTLRGDDVCLPLLQPSGQIICAEVSHDADGRVSGKISGPVVCGAVYEIEV